MNQTRTPPPPIHSRANNVSLSSFENRTGITAASTKTVKL